MKLLSAPASYHVVLGTWVVPRLLNPVVINKPLLITVGAPIAGRISDQIVTRCRKGRGGIWYPEDRLKATLFGAFILVPLSVLFCGLLTTYVPGKLGLILNLTCLFLNGIGVSRLNSSWLYLSLWRSFFRSISC